MLLKIELNISGDNLDYSYITDTLDLEPTKQLQSRITGIGSWAYCFEVDKPETDEELWNSFFKTFDKRRSEIRKLIDSKGYRLAIYIVMENMDDGLFTLSLDNHIVQLLADIKGEIQAEFYVGSSS